MPPTLPREDRPSSSVGERRETVHVGQQGVVLYPQGTAHGGQCGKTVEVGQYRVILDIQAAGYACECGQAVHVADVFAFDPQRQDPVAGTVGLLKAIDLGLGVQGHAHRVAVGRPKGGGNGGEDQ